MDRDVRQRLKWVELYEETGDAGLVCRRCGVSRPTLRKWWKRYENSGLAGLESQNRRPKSSPNRKVGEVEEKLILDLRKKRNLGARRIRNELQREHDLSLSLATIHKVLARNDVAPIKKLRKNKKFKRYSKAIPGERVQMDTTKIASGLYQFTAVDDCSRYRVLRVYKRATAKNTLDFIDCVIEEMPFPIQRVQTDRGREFFAVKVQEKFMEYGIKFRPNKPAAPHLNGKVERSQRTDKEEFYATIDLSDFETVEEELGLWQHHYNWFRSHGSLKGKTPIEVLSELSAKTPLSQEVSDNYEPEAELIQEANYQMDLQLRALQDKIPTPKN